MSFIQTLLITLGLFIAPMAHTEGGRWFDEGERLSYLVEMWGWLDVGEAEILYRPAQGDNAEYSLTARAWTYADIFKLRDRLTVKGVHESENQNYFLVETYVQELNENKYRAHKKTTFERAKGMVYYQNIHGKEQPIGFGAQPHLRDMMSALYNLRKKLPDAKIGDSFTSFIIQNEQQYRMTLKVIGTDTVEGHHTLRVLPETVKINQSGEEFGEVRDKWTLWVKDDGSFLPVKIEARTKFGRFVATLKNAGSVRTPSKAPPELPEVGPIIMVNLQPSLLLNTAD